MYLEKDIKKRYFKKKRELLIKKRIKLKTNIVNEILFLNIYKFNEKNIITNIF